MLHARHQITYFAHEPYERCCKDDSCDLSQGLVSVLALEPLLDESALLLLLLS